MKYKLRDILDRYGHTQKELAALLGITYQSVSLKINRHKDFTQTEIFKIIQYYKLTPEQVVEIFFDPDGMYARTAEKEEFI